MLVASQHMPFPIQDVILIFSFIGKIAAKDVVACFSAMPSSSPAYMDCQFPEEKGLPYQHQIDANSLN